MRRNRAERRSVIPDPRYNNEVIARFVNSVMERGKKSLASRIVYEALELIGERSKRPPLEVFEEAMKNSTPLVEVKPRRVGGATYQVPLEVPADRQASLALRWLVDFADARKGVPMQKALASEIMEAFQGQGNAIRKRDEVHKMAQANKAFAHFRW